MHELTFADAAIPAPAECLGLPLAPYCLRHELVLLRHRSPFLCLTVDEFNAQPRPQQVFAISFAAQICAARSPGWFWQWRKRGQDYALAVAEFRNYLAAGRNLLPALSSSDDRDKEAYEIANNGEKMTAGRPLGSPLLAQLIHFCIAEMRLTYEEALESPFAHVGNLYFANLEAKGSLYVENHAEAAARAEMVAKRAEVVSETEQARKDWETATTDEAKAAAYAKNPRIGNLFAAEWYQAADGTARDALVAKWGIVAETELANAGIKRKEAVCQD